MVQGSKIKDIKILLSHGLIQLFSYSVIQLFNY